MNDGKSAWLYLSDGKFETSLKEIRLNKYGFLDFNQHTPPSFLAVIFMTTGIVKSEHLAHLKPVVNFLDFNHLASSLVTYSAHAVFKSAFIVEIIRQDEFNTFAYFCLEIRILYESNTSLMLIIFLKKRLSEKSRKSHKQKPQPTPDTSRKRKGDTD